MAVPALSRVIDSNGRLVDAAPKTVRPEALRLYAVDRTDMNPPSAFARGRHDEALGCNSIV
jgi:hypothetical protein